MKFRKVLKFENGGLSPQQIMAEAKRNQVAYQSALRQEEIAAKEAALAGYREQDRRDAIAGNRILMPGISQVPTPQRVQVNTNAIGNAQRYIPNSPRIPSRDVISPQIVSTKNVDTQKEETDTPDTSSDANSESNNTWGGKIYGGTVPENQVTISQDTTSGLVRKIQNGWDNFLYKAGWKSDGDREGRGRTRKLVEDMVVPATAGAFLSQLPIVTSVISGASIPGAYKQAEQSWSDEDATTGEIIRETFPLAANMVAFGAGAYNAPKSFNNALSNAKNTTRGVRVRDPNAGKGTSVKNRATRRGNNVVRQNVKKGQGHQGYANRGARSGNPNNPNSRSGGYQQAGHLVNQTVAPNSPTVVSKMGPIRPPVTTIPPFPYSNREGEEQSVWQNRTWSAPAYVQRQEVSRNVPYLGSPEFQKTFQQNADAGNKSFTYGGKEIVIDYGNPSVNVRTESTRGIPQEVLSNDSLKFWNDPNARSVNYNIDQNNLPEEGISNIGEMVRMQDVPSETRTSLLNIIEKSKNNYKGNK